MNPTALDILKAGRARLADPSAWGKGSRGDEPRRPRHTFCAAEALEESQLALKACRAERMRSDRALIHAAGLDFPLDSITSWNDAPERQHIDVIRAYDLAIATLSLGAPVRRTVAVAP